MIRGAEGAATGYQARTTVGDSPIHNVSSAIHSVSIVAVTGTRAEGAAYRGQAPRRFGWGRREEAIIYWEDFIDAPSPRHLMASAVSKTVNRGRIVS
jgi:hypothetical protein